MLDARALKQQVFARRQIRDLQDQRRRSVGIFLRALREIFRRSARPGRRPARNARRPASWPAARRCGSRASWRRRPRAASAGSSQSGVSWSQSVRRPRRRVGDSGSGGCARPPPAERAGPRHGVHHGAENRLSVEDGIGEAAGDLARPGPSVLSPHHGEEVDLGGGGFGAALRVGLGVLSRAAARRSSSRPSRGYPRRTSLRRGSRRAAPSPCRGRAHRRGRSGRTAAVPWRA